MQSRTRSQSSNAVRRHLSTPRRKHLHRSFAEPSGGVRHDGGCYLMSRLFGRQIVVSLAIKGLQLEGDMSKRQITFVLVATTALGFASVVKAESLGDRLAALNSSSQNSAPMSRIPHGIKQ